ncbi:MAG: substrate-binding domain-containing protein [Chthoniobacterales bacterium]
MQIRPRIYVMLTTSDFDRSIFETVTGYFAENAPEMEVDLELAFPEPEMLQNARGIITRVLNPTDAKLMRAYGVPVVNISGFMANPGLPSVIIDYALSARLVADHLLARRFHSFGFYGQLKTNPALLQSQHFEQTIHSAGFPCELHFQTWPSHAYAVDPADQLNLREWVKNLPKPAGIFCGGDRYAWELSKACVALDLTVGKDVGIVGFGNEEFFCKTRHPQLSSVATSPDRVALEAATMLLRLINGEALPAELVRLPAPVIARASSDQFVTDDPHVAMALKFIQDHISQPLSIQAVVDHVPLSRDSLERRFRKHLDYTIMETIHLLKIDHIKHLLISTSKTMEEIARACGLSGGPYMTTLFREKVGMTPSEYRSSFHGGGSACAPSPSVKA